MDCASAGYDSSQQPKIMQALETNADLIPSEMIEDILLFRDHASGYEQNQYGRLDHYQLFPTSFAEASQSGKQMANGSNDFGVTFAQISWISRWPKTHENVVSSWRSNDIQFDIRRKHGRPIWYDMSRRIHLWYEDFGGSGGFPDMNLIYVGGNWNSYTMEAKEYCLEAKLGLFNTSELAGAFYRDDFGAYHKKDKDGNPVYLERHHCVQSAWGFGSFFERVTSQI